jgi:3',5'-cyclic AMP phosphodiesterase CpdA
MPTTILHLSDIHYGNDFIPWAILHGRGFSKRPSDSLRRGLEDSVRQLKPDFVIISGDFVNKPGSKWFSESAQYLRDIFTNCGIDIRKQVLIVPGNHDVSFWGKKSEDTVRLTKYQAFVAQLYEDANLEPRQPRFVKRVDDHNLIFLMLDTTLRSLVPVAEGEIGDTQLTWAREKLKELSLQLGAHYHKYAKVAVMHHHCVPIPGDSTRKERNMQLLDAAGIMSLLKDQQFDLVLHGHKHVPHISKVLREDGGGLTVVGAGTTLAPYLDQQAGCGNSFNLLQLNHSAMEVKVSRYHAQSDGAFRIQVGPETYPLFTVLQQGFQTKKLRRIIEIAGNGDNSITIERSGILVTGSNRIRTLPVRITSETPGSKIHAFNFRKTGASTMKWKITDDQMYDGWTVFPSERTSADGEISLIYDYKIALGTVMSVAEMARRFTSSVSPFEESVISMRSVVEQLEVEIRFPRNYPVAVQILFERYGVYLDSNSFRGRYSLQYDEPLNAWTLLMNDPPLDHGITLRWDLPQEWASTEN